MQALPKEYEMSVCEVKTMDNDLLVAGFISKINDDYIQISSYKDERLPILKFDLPVKISIHNARKGFRIVAGQVYVSADQVLRIVNVNNLQDFERRAFFRVQVKMPSKITPLPDEFEGGTDHASADIPVVVENLSLSGLLFYPEDPKVEFFMGDRYAAELALPGGTLNFNVKICRFEKIGNKPTKYGCEFFGYTQKQSDRLCSYIFEIERDILKSRKKAPV